MTQEPNNPKPDDDKNLSSDHIHIEGDVTAGGDMVIGSGTINKAKQDPTCPTAPEPPAHFTGRIAELKTLREQLLSGEVTAITAVQSMGGMGKTTLAQKLCHLDETPFGAIFWADITPNPDPASILRIWAQHAVPEYQLPQDATLEQMADQIRPRLTDLVNNKCGTPVLIVLDDVWNDNDGKGYNAVEILKRAAPKGAHTLITTRDDDVAQRFQAKRLQLHELSDGEAFDLLHKLRKEDFISDDHLKRAVSIIKGHPLALEIAIASLNQAIDADDVNDILDDYEKGVNNGSPFDAMSMTRDAPRSLNVVFERSYNALPDDTRTHFRLLGVLASETAWSQSMAGAVWNVDDNREQTNIHKTLIKTAFIDHDKVTSKDYDGRWYTQHPLLRAYGRALMADDEQTAAWDRYVAHVTEEAEQFNTLPPQDWKPLDPLIPHVEYVGDTLSAAYLASDNPSDALAQQVSNFGGATYKYLYYRKEALFTLIKGSRQPTRMDWLRTSLQATQQVHNGKRASLLENQLGVMLEGMGDNHGALHYYEKALIATRQLSNKEQEAAILNNIGMVYDNLSQRNRALIYFEQALLIYHEAGNRQMETATLNNIGVVYLALGQYGKALGYFDKVLTIIHKYKNGNRAQEAGTLNNIGMIYRKSEQYDRALDYYRKALPIMREVGDRSGEATTLNNIGMVYDAIEQPDEALRHFNLALPILRKVGNRVGESATLNNIGMIYLNNQEYNQAVDIFRQIITIMQSTGGIAEEAAFRVNLATTLNKINQVDEAILQVEQALKILKTNNLLQDAAGQTIFAIADFLKQLKSKRDRSDDAKLLLSDEVMGQLAVLYQIIGADVLREMLRGQVPDEVIEQIIQQFKKL